MACPTVTTGSRFLEGTLGHLDCQAQALGSFGFQALSQPGSPASLALTGLLTLFIALFAIRLLFGSDVHPRDGVSAALKIGIVLTLAMSWPAFRTLAYDTVLRGPAEVAATITPSTLPDSGGGFAARLQNIDTGIASLTALGTGRQTGSLELEDTPDGAFRAIALQDESAFGWARTLYLGSAIGSLAILRLGGGLLLALAPLFAGLLLFETTRGLFAGWLRGLVLVALGSLAMTVLLAVEVALLEPWLVDAVDRRTLGYATPAAPTELLAMTLAFAIASAGLLFLLAKVAFQNAWGVASVRHISERIMPPLIAPASRPAPWTAGGELAAQPRALAIGESVSSILRREKLVREGSWSPRRIGGPDRVDDGRLPSAGPSHSPEPLGSGYRRTSRGETGSQARRDDRP